MSLCTAPTYIVPCYALLQAFTAKVQAMYFHCWRVNWADFQNFIMGEVRYNSLLKTFPEEAKELFTKTEQFAKLRYEGYKRLSEGK